MLDLALSGVQAGLSILGGFFGGSAAEKAAKIQKNAATAAGQDYRDTVASVNPGITQAAARAGDRAVTTAQDAATGIDQATALANAKLEQANKGFTPYTQAGGDAASVLQSGIAPGGAFNKEFGPEDFKIDPSYQFLVDQSTKALDRKGAAEGGALGGAQLQSALTLRNNLASTEYGKAFERFRQSMGDRFSNVFKTAGLGLNATEDVSGNLNKEGQNQIAGSVEGGRLNTRASEYAGNADMSQATQVAQNTLGGSETQGKYNTDAAAAEASGIIGGHNARWGGITGAGNTVTGALRFNELLKTPASNWNGGINPAYARNPLGGGGYGAGPMRP